MSAPRLQTITDHTPTGPPPAPARSGQPWTEEDYQQLVSLVRDGADEGAVAEALQRSPSTITPRVRRLLPVEERRCPGDRVLVAVREHLSDPDYDWRHVMLLSETPQPLPPPVVRSGVGGLSNDELVTIAYAVLSISRDSTGDLSTRIARETQSRGLVHHLVHRRVERLLHRPSGSALTGHEATDIASRWVLEAPAWRQSGEEDYWASAGSCAYLEDNSQPWYRSPN